MVSPSLRTRLVDAGARAINDEIGAELQEHLAHILRKWPNTIESLSEAALDAMLDCLAENADEWADYPEADPIVVAHREIICRKLLATLREDR